MDKDLKPTGCCPKFDPAPWDDKIITWQDKRFIKGKVFTFLFMPINFGSVIGKLMKKAEAVNAVSIENLCLSDHTSKWNMDIYLAVDKEVAGAENVKLSGKFYSKVYEGDFKETGEWAKDYESRVKEKGLKIKKMYMWYTTCPKCAKYYGKNYTVFLSQME